MHVYVMWARMHVYVCVHACHAQSMHARCVHCPRRRALSPVTFPDYHPYQAPSSLSMLLARPIKSPPRPIAPRLRADDAISSAELRSSSSSSAPTLTRTLSLSLSLSLSPSPSLSLSLSPTLSRTLSLSLSRARTQSPTCSNSNPALNPSPNHPNSGIRVYEACGRLVRVMRRIGGVCPLCTAPRSEASCQASQQQHGCASPSHCRS